MGIAIEIIPVATGVTQVRSGRSVVLMNDKGFVRLTRDACEQEQRNNTTVSGTLPEVKGDRFLW
eukprot:4471785-Amphidinium_carterae.1